MTAENPSLSRKHSKAYDIFILVLTVISLVIMVVMLLPLGEETIGLLQIYDNLICAVFLIDFALNLRLASKKSDYFIKERGWLDLLGSIPSLGIFFRYSGLLRLARLSRLSSIARQLGREQRGDLLRDIVQYRSHYAALITILLTFTVLATASVLVLQFESQSSEASITTGWDAFWYSIVTITTVGYGDYYPVTVEGRITGIFIMITGIGIIGALASILSSVLVGSPPAQNEEDASVPSSATRIEQELTEIKDEMAVLRQLLEKASGQDDRK